MLLKASKDILSIFSKRIQVATESIMAMNLLQMSSKKRLSRTKIEGSILTPS